MLDCDALWTCKEIKFRRNKLPACVPEFGLMFPATEALLRLLRVIPTLPFMHGWTFCFHLHRLVAVGTTCRKADHKQSVLSSASEWKTLTQW